MSPVGRALETDGYVLLVITLVVQVAFFYYLIRGRRGQRIQEAVEQRIHHRLLSVLVTLFLYLTLYRLVLLPVNYAGYRIHRFYGVATQSDLHWIADVLRSWAVNTCVIVPVLMLLLWAMNRWPRRWWLAATALMALTSAIVIYLAPLIVDPLFHHFTPLKDPALRQSILDLAARAHVHVNGVYEGQFSSTTTEGNAYVTGLGSSQRIVVWDTIVKNKPYPLPELNSILAHELGHYALHHIFKGLLLGILGSGILFYLVHRILLLGIHQGWVRRMGEPAVVIPLAASLIALNWVSLPISNAVSRTMESQADQFSLHLTHNPAAFIASMQRLCRQDKDDPWPNSFQKWVFYTHPSIAERIHAAFVYAQENRLPVQQAAH
ncbi:MAG: M48 family metallopeptidase [Armatimonadota bacterium]|nr:M48 family metallopeptidase [Armatimonadota bacterium]